jgi:RNA polymerase sigma factor (sigma-70 family)
MNLNDAYSQYRADPSQANHEVLGAALVQYIHRNVQNIFKRKCRGEELSDIEGDALLHVLESLPTFKGEARFTTWVTSILGNRGKDLIRKESRKAALPILENEGMHDPGPSVSQQILLNGLVAQLDPYDRMLVHLKMRGYTNSEVAFKIDAPVGTVDRQWKEIQAKLRTLSGGINETI